MTATVTVTDDGLGRPVEVRDADLGLVDASPAGSAVRLDAGLYLVATFLDDGTPFQRALELHDGDRAVLVVPPALQRRASGASPWLDYAEFATAATEQALPRSRATTTALGSAVAFEPDDRDGVLLIAAPLADAGMRCLVRLPPTRAAMSVEMADDSAPSPALPRAIPGNSTALTVATRLIDAGRRRAALELLRPRVFEDRDPLLSTLFGLLALRAGEQDRALIADIAGGAGLGLADTWVLRGQMSRLRGDDDGANEAFAQALLRGVPVFSDSVSYLLAGLRNGIPKHLDSEGRLAGVLTGLADLAARSLRSRTVVTAVATERQLLDILDVIARSLGTVLLRPETYRPAATPSTLAAGLRRSTTTVPWRLAGPVGAAAVATSRGLRRFLRPPVVRRRVGLESEQLLDVPVAPLEPEIQRIADVTVREESPTDAPNLRLRAEAEREDRYLPPEGV